jgi:hypothetical protein
MLPLTAAQMLAIFRAEVSDLQEGVSSSEPDSENLWKDAEIYRYMYEAEAKVARKTGLLQHVFTLPVVANVATINLPSWVLDINHCRLTSNGRELFEMNSNEAAPHEDDYGHYGSVNPLFDQTGAPQRYIRDYDGGGKRLRLWPTPVEADTLTISAKTLPRRPILTDGTGAEVLSFTDPDDIRLMLHWMKHLAYQKQDADTFDKDASARYRAYFDAGATERDGENARVRRRVGTVRYGGI